MVALAPRFADPAAEQAFLAAERKGRGRAIRALIVIASLTLLSYIFLNPLHFPPEGVTAYSAAAALLIGLMAALFLFSRSRFYRERPIVDLGIFIVMAGAMGWLAHVLAGLAPYTGFPPHIMIIVQLSILMLFASVGFAGTFRLYVAWSLVLLGLVSFYLMTEPGIPDISRVYTLTNFSTIWIFALYFNWDVERRGRETFSAKLALEAEQAKTEELLHNVLPEAVADRLKAGDEVADAFTDVTVVFVDLVGFSRLARRLSPGHLVRLLNDCFSAADRCAGKHGIEKVKTIGDAYLAVAGGMASSTAQTGAAIAFARDLIAELKGVGDGTIVLEARVGVHVGPVVGGVIGSKRLSYDYWGDTMNVASRLQAAASANGIALSEAAYLQVGPVLAFEARTIDLKGIGETQIHVASLD